MHYEYILLNGFRKAKKDYYCWVSCSFKLLYQTHTKQNLQMQYLHLKSCVDDGLTSTNYAVCVFQGGKSYEQLKQELGQKNISLDRVRSVSCQLCMQVWPCPCLLFRDLNTCQAGVVTMQLPLQMSFPFYYCESCC